MISPANGSKNIMTAQEVSDFLKIPLSTLYGLSKKGKIRGVKIGKHWRYLEEDIYEYFYGSPSPISRVPEAAAVRPAEHPVFVDRRQFDRLNCEIEGRLSGLLDSHGSEVIDCVIKNVSSRGLFFTKGMNGIALRVGDPIEISFKVPNSDDSTTVKAEGRIVHTQDPSSSFGVKFRNLSTEDLGAIQQYVG